MTRTKPSSKTAARRITALLVLLACALPAGSAQAAAPIDAAIAANANIAAPIDAAVSANILSPGSTALAVADQDSVIIQTLQGVANATTTQTSTIEQGEVAGMGPGS